MARTIKSQGVSFVFTDQTDPTITRRQTFASVSQTASDEAIFEFGTIIGELLPNVQLSAVTVNQQLTLIPGA